MDRAFSSGSSASPPTAPASPSIGYATAGNPGTGTAATKPGPYWYHMMTEEMRAVVVAGGLTPSQSDVTQLLQAITLIVAEKAVPPGTIIDHGGTTAPAGYLACPTSATNLNRVTYAAMFAKIGITWGAGDGVTTFGMPFFPANYAAVQASGNVGTQTVGDNLAHTHSGVMTSLAGNNGGTGPGTNEIPTYGASTSSGGSANLAAGSRVLKCVKY